MRHPDMRAVSFTVSTFFLFSAGMTQYLIRRRLKRASLLVRPWPIRLGDEIEVKFRATLRNASPVTAIAAKLECVEEATKGSGRYKEVKRETLLSIDLPAPVVKAAGERKVTESWKVAIPASSPPSLTIPSNTVRWLLKTAITTEDVEVPATFELLVVPEVVGD